LKQINFQDEDMLFLLRHIEEQGTQKQLAALSGFSIGKVNYILKALVDKSLVKAGNFVRSEDKTGYRYLLTPDGIKTKIELTEKFIERKKREYEALENELIVDKASLSVISH